jgi:glycosyltransferase involved in cell wall biosynthesis
MKISAVIITYNEERNIEACLKSVSFCDEIVVVDSGSVDGTLALIKKHTLTGGAPAGGAPTVYFRPFDHFSAQKNEAVSKATSDWILSIDADERVSEALQKEILDVIRSNPRANHESLWGPCAYHIPRKNFIFGSHLKFGANRGDAPVRLFRRGFAAFEGAIHERLSVPDSLMRIGKLKSQLIHLSSPTLKDYMRRLDHYTQLEATQMRDRRERFSYLKFFVKPPLRFIQRYFLQGGFLDGRKGFIYCALGSFYEFVRYAKLWELERNRCAP